VSTPAVTRPGERQVYGMTPSRRPSRRWQVVAAVEVVLSALAVIFDLAIPTFVILALMVVSLLIHRQGLSTMGFHRVHHPWTRPPRCSPWPPPGRCSTLVC
jgi:hypothetical protein